MLRHCVVALLVVFGGAITANADITLPGTSNVHLTFDVVCNTTADPAYDRLDFMLTGLTGPAAGYAVNIIQGEWVATGGTFSLASDAAVAAYNIANETSHTWENFTSNTLAPNNPLAPYGQTQPLSYVNFASIVDGYASWGRTGSGMDFTDFAGSWYTTGSAGWLVPGNRMARLWVKKGWQEVDFINPPGSDPEFHEGGVSFSYGGGTVEYLPPGSALFSVQNAPEPGTLVLSALGLLGLLVYGARPRQTA
jgi:hypothetical protein